MQQDGVSRVTLLGLATLEAQSTLNLLFTLKPECSSTVCRSEECRNFSSLFERFRTFNNKFVKLYLLIKDLIYHCAPYRYWSYFWVMRPHGCKLHCDVSEFLTLSSKWSGYPIILSIFIIQITLSRFHTSKIRVQIDLFRQRNYNNINYKQFFK